MADALRMWVTDLEELEAVKTERDALKSERDLLLRGYANAIRYLGYINGHEHLAAMARKDFNTWIEQYR